MGKRMTVEKTLDEVLQNSILSSTKDGGWSKTDDNKYTFYLENKTVVFDYNQSNGTFNCDTSIELCHELNK